MIVVVTDPNKQVTDPVLLAELTKQGIDSSGVEFTQDYALPTIGEKGKSPYAKFYRDLNSNKRFMVVSGLPMVDADGIKIDPRWKKAGINYFEATNLFKAKVQGTQVTLITRNDQPDGRKTNDKLTFNPQLFIDGTEQLPSTPLLLPVDPLNSNYLENTLEWDYGNVKRLLRQVEGSVQGYWLRPVDFTQTMKIVYNQSGDFRLKLGQFAVDNDTEEVPAVISQPQFVPTVAYQGVTYYLISDSATFYPDAHPESTSVDGRAAYSGSKLWADIRVANGTGSLDDETAAAVVFIQATATTNYWASLYRSILLFNTAGLPDNATVTGAVFSQQLGKGGDNLNLSPSFAVYSSAPASNTALGASDFQTVGSTLYSGTCAYSALPTSYAYVDFIFNSTGIAAVSKTGVTKLSLSEANYDRAGNLATWSSNNYTQIFGYYAEQGNGYKPKLVVTYILWGPLPMYLP